MFPRPQEAPQVAQGLAVSLHLQRWRRQQLLPRLGSHESIDLLPPRHRTGSQHTKRNGHEPATSAQTALQSQAISLTDQQMLRLPEQQDGDKSTQGHASPPHARYAENQQLHISFCRTPTLAHQRPVHCRCAQGCLLGMRCQPRGQHMTCPGLQA